MNNNYRTHDIESAQPNFTCVSIYIRMRSASTADRNLTLAQLEKS